MLHEWFEKIVSAVGMQKVDENPYGCGIYLKGFGDPVTGSGWYYQYQSLLAVTKCDFIFTKSRHLNVSAEAKYLGLRLDYARHLPPGKVMAFLEEDELSIDVTIQSGTRIAYTEIIFSPELYKKHFTNAFSESLSNPVDIIRNMGDNHNWSSKITKILIDVSQSSLFGPAAELYYIGKSCELMSALIEMGTERLPHKTSDYEEIQRVLHYIDENYRNNIKQSDLVQLANMSPTKLKTLFKNFTNRSISDYILDKKADHAAHMLAETDISIYELALSLGFSTVSGFSTSFKKRVGLSPSAYRNQLKFSFTNNVSYLQELTKDTDPAASKK